MNHEEFCIPDCCIFEIVFVLMCLLLFISSSDSFIDIVVISLSV